MVTQPQLDAALSLFHDQGWDVAEQSDAPDLPLGSRSEQAAAARELRTVTLDALAIFDVNPTMVGLFAIRLGVTPKIALELLVDVEQDALAACVALRGEKYAADFIKEACYITDKDNHDLYGGSYCGYASVMLVVQDNDLELDIPQDAAYLHDWVAVASDLLANDWAPQFNYAAHVLEESELKATLREHIVAAVAMGLPIYGPLGHVLLAALEERKLSRQNFIVWSLQQLAQGLPAVAVGRITQLLSDELKITDKEIAHNSVKMLEAIRRSDRRLMEVFGLRLLEFAPTSQVAKVAELLLSHPSDSYHNEVLEMLKTGRAVSKRQQQLLLPHLLVYQKTGPKLNAALTETLIRAWDSEPVPVVVPAAGDEHAQYRWQSMPGTWQPEPVEYPRASFQLLLEQTTSLSPSNSFSTLETEYFWHTFVWLATGNLGNLAKKLKKVNHQIRGGTVARWVNNPFGFRANLNSYSTVTAAREQEILENLGQVPCLLSAPSFQDLSISLDDFLARLRIFTKQDKAVPLMDVYFALRRLNVDGMSAESLEKRCGKYSITISVSEGPLLTRMCYRLIRDFQNLALATEPEVFSQSQAEEFEKTAFSSFLQQCLELDPIPYPLVADANDSVLKWSKARLSRDVHDYARQIARSRHKLAPATAMKLLCVQCRTANPEDETIYETLKQVWYRGLLDPKSIDVNAVSWSSREREVVLAKFIEVLLKIAEDDMLAVAWHVLDQVAEAIAHQRPTADLSPLVNAIQQLYPSVHAAVNRKEAQYSVLELPGLEAITANKASKNNAAVKKAKQLLSLIAAEKLEAQPTVETEKQQLPEAADAVPSLIDEYWFAKNWIQEYSEIPGEPDDASVVIYNPKAITAIGDSPPEQQVKKALADDPRSLFANDFHAAFIISQRENSVFVVETSRWLASGDYPHHWQAIEKQDTSIDDLPWLMQLSWLKSRGWLIGSHESEVRKVKSEALPDSIAAIMIAFLSAEREQDETISLVKTYVEAGLLGPAAVKAGVKLALECTDWRPQVALKILKQHPHLLAALWPLITESLKAAAKRAGISRPIPRWVNPLLLFSIDYGLVLAAATALGYIQADDWAGLYQLTASIKKNQATRRAKELTKLLGTYLDSRK